MKRKTTSLVVISAAAVALVVIAATAGSLLADTPLYTLRMEQLSSEMHFLPTAVNGFDYNTENGYTMDHDVAAYSSPLFGDTVFQKTCWGITCTDPTCPETCPATCYLTCPNTCGNTCPATCPATCNPTCNDFTCKTCQTCITCIEC